MQIFLTNLFINLIISSQNNFLFYIMCYDKMETLKKIKVALNPMYRIFKLCEKLHLILLIKIKQNKYNMGFIILFLNFKQLKLTLRVLFSR